MGIDGKGRVTFGPGTWIALAGLFLTIVGFGLAFVSRVVAVETKVDAQSKAQVEQAAAIAGQFDSLERDIREVRAAILR